MIVTADVGRTSSQIEWFWHVAAPASAYGAVQLPTLPTDVFDFSVHADDNSRLDPAIAVHADGGYDAARAHVLDRSFSPTIAAVGTAGTASETFLVGGDQTPSQHR